MNKQTSRKILLSCLNAVIPGSGYIALGRYSYAAACQALLFLPLLLLSLSGLIFYPAGITALISMVIVVHCASALHIYFIARANTNKKIYFVILLLILTTAIIVSMRYHKEVLGVEFYYVPSMSMYPTIKPGQFILADSNAYVQHEPSTGDIIIFKHQANTLIKRIANNPNKQSNASPLIYVLGDHPTASIDSRQFGLISKQQVLAQAKLALITFNPPDNFHLSLTPLK